MSNKLPRTDRREFLKRFVGVTAAVALGGTALTACGPSGVNAEPGTSSSTATPDKPATSPDVAKPISVKYEADPTKTDFYDGLSESDKELFEKRWSPINKETYSGPIEDRLKMSVIVTGIYSEIAAKAHGETSGEKPVLEVTYEDVEKNPNLAVDSFNTRLDLAYDIVEQSARTNRYYTENNTPEDEQSVNTQIAYQHIAAGLVTEIIAKDTTNTNLREDASIIQFAAKLNQSFLDTYNEVLQSGEAPSSSSRYQVPQIYTEKLPEDDDRITYYLNDKPVIHYAGGKQTKINTATFNVLYEADGEVKQFHDRFGNKGLIIMGLRTDSDKPSAWAINNVSDDPYTITPVSY